jgi:hypothetical protein
MRRWLTEIATTEISVAPLITFRILFGAATFISTLRFMLLGWVDLHFVHTQVQFKYYGFEWVQLLSPAIIYAIHILMLLASLGILLGTYYRICAIVFFVCFTYSELIDLTYYLNHYYFVSLVALLMCVVPANIQCSIDAWRKPTIQRPTVPAWCINIFKAQLIIVYFFAGIAKINYDWLINALPLRIWLPANDELPIIGWLFKYNVTAYIFSWVGMLFDISVGYFLLIKRTRFWAWVAVVIFHILTGWMFQIGVFPLVMIVSTMIFFSATFHQNLLQAVQQFVPMMTRITKETTHFIAYYNRIWFKKAIAVFLIGWFSFQLLFPFRYLLYPGNIFWTEEGYRFSWRVMLMEKAGTAIFYVTDETTGKEGVVDNRDFLNIHQEKQMAMQPDLILQYAQFLKRHYENRGAKVSSVRAEVYITLNARPSQLLISDTLNLLTVSDSWKPKTWILPANEK